MRVDTSWIDIDEDQACRGGVDAPAVLSLSSQLGCPSENIDVVKTLDLLPGEDRTESIRVVLIGSPGTGIDRRDCRVTVRECRACEPSKGLDGATTVVDFSGVLYSPLLDDPSTNSINTRAESYRLVSSSCCPDNDAATTESAPSSLLVSELRFEFHADTTVYCMDVFVEVFAVDDGSADLITELSRHTIATVDDCTRLPNEFFTKFPEDRLQQDLTVFSRVLSIRIRFNPVPGVRLTRYDRLLSDESSDSSPMMSVQLPVSAHEASRVSAAISEVLIRHGNRGSPFEISLLQPRTKVLFEVGLSTHLPTRGSHGRCAFISVRQRIGSGSVVGHERESAIWMACRALLFGGGNRTSCQYLL